MEPMSDSVFIYSGPQMVDEPMRRAGRGICNGDFIGKMEARSK